MSAFLCSDNHLNAMLGYLFGAKDEITYYDGDRPGRPFTRADALAMLREENIRSLRDRYGYADGEPAQVMTPDTRPPVEVLKLCDCYDYQSCETDDYRSTDAAKLVRACRAAAINALPGYDRAPWTI